MKTHFFYALLILLLTPSTALSNASNFDEIITTSPSWDTFTNKDGTGLYHEVMREVFRQYDIKVRHEYSKSSRSEELVMLENADIMTCDDKTIPPLTMARFPMYQNIFYVFFKKHRIGPWMGVETLRDKEILSQPSFYDQTNFTVPVNVKEVMTGKQALSMILMNRSDFYADDLILIQQSIKENVLPFNMDDFEIQEVGRRSYYPLFNTNERGKQLMKVYEDGILKLHKSGKLKSIYDKWGHQYPDFDSF